MYLVCQFPVRRLPENSKDSVLDILKLNNQMSNGERIRMTNGCLIVVAAEYGTKRGLGVLGDSIRMCM